MANDPMKEWMLKDEVLAAFHGWPVIVIFTLVGALIGLAAANLWPAPYRAQVDVSVELNPYRVLDDQYLPAFTNAEFRNVDDYKHWQMLQLSIIVQSDPYMTETLTRLQAIDPYWDSISEQKLREMLSADWRNAGRWSLIATADSESMASDAVHTWSNVVLDLTRDAIASSQSLYQVELTLRALKNHLVENQLQITMLNDLLSDSDVIVSELEKLDQDTLLPDGHFEKLMKLKNQLTEYLPEQAWTQVSFPDRKSNTADYLNWSETAIGLMNDQIENLQLREQILDQEIGESTDLWEIALQDGQGLAATLNLEQRGNSSPGIQRVRSYGLAVIVGSLVGLLAWIGYFLFQITRKGYR
jgi:hypothetical protein